MTIVETEVGIIIVSMPLTSRMFSHYLAPTSKLGSRLRCYFSLLRTSGNRSQKIQSQPDWQQLNPSMKPFPKRIHTELGEIEIRKSIEQRVEYVSHSRDALVNKRNLPKHGENNGTRAV